MKEVNIICINHYEENPIVQFCLDKYQSKNIITEKEVRECLPHCKHSKWAFENQRWNFVGDQIRLFLAMQSNDFTYVDGDSWVRNLDLLKIDSVCLENDGNINDGSYFRANKDTEWVKHYYEIYNKITENEYTLVNYDIHKKYPTTFPTQKLNYTHFYTSWFNRISKKLTSPTLCYTMFRDRAQQEIMKGHNVLWFCPSAGDTYYSKYNAILWQYTFCPIDLFNAQLDYSCGRHVSLINLDNSL